MNFPKFLYHATEAPKGLKINDPSEMPEGDGWVDTPAAFGVTEDGKPDARYPQAKKAAGKKKADEKPETPAE